MAQTVNVMNGTDLAVYFGTSSGSEALIAHATECSISFSEDARDITTKDSAGWRELLEGLRSFNVSTSHLHAENDTTNVQDIWSAFNTRSKVYLLMSTEQTGDYRFACEARISSIEMSAATEDNVTYSVQFEGTGEPTYLEIT